MMGPFAISFISILFLYAVVMGIVRIGLASVKTPGQELPGAPVPVTVVVPFRNEAGNLMNLLDDLSGQLYPADLLSVILVNDHSTDGSGDLARVRASKRPGFTCLDLPEGARGKKAALELAVSMATSDWIIQTDADCRVGPGFVQSHVAWLEQHPSDLVAGWVTTREEGGGFLEAFERTELLGLTGTGAASFSLGRPVMCSGANLMYTKALHGDTRRFDPGVKVASGDDMFLMIGARKLGKKLTFNPGRQGMVQTGVAPGFGSLIGQRIRWGGKSTRYRVADIQLLALLVAVANLMVFLVPLFAVLLEGSGWWFAAGTGLKVAADFMVVTAAAGKTGQRVAPWWYLPVLLLYHPYMVLVIAGSLLNSPSWKGR